MLCEQRKNLPNQCKFRSRKWLVTRLHPSRLSAYNAQQIYDLYADTAALARMYFLVTKYLAGYKWGKNVLPVQLKQQSR